MKKNKIAILTQPLKGNYGGILQAFALQKIVKELGYEVTTIDRQKKQNLSIRETLRLFKNITYNRISNKRKPYFPNKQLNTIYNNSIEFIRRTINMSEYIDCSNDLKNHFHRNNYDTVIVGSDQTWRPIYSPNILNYFFDFLQDDKKIKKISYAASFGTDKWEFSTTETEKCEKLIQQFDAISVREFSAIKMCNDYFNINAQLVLDPTLLLLREDYTNIINASEIYLTEPHGIFTYVLDKTDNKTKIIKTVSSLLDLPVFTNQPKEIYGISTSHDIKDYNYPPVEGWLNAFLKADFIIADSFHGIVFSILFNKNFIAIGNEERGLARFKSLLKLFNLEHRLISEEGKFPENLLFENIDFKKVNRTLEELRVESINFLKNNL